MNKNCFNCNSFPGCNVLNKMLSDGEDGMDEIVLMEFGKACEEFVSKY